MRIAVTTDDGKSIFPHFGGSPYFAIIEIEESKIITQSLRWNNPAIHICWGHGRHQQGENH